MSNRAFNRAAQLVQSVIVLISTCSRAIALWILRSVLRFSAARNASIGFIFPTTLLLLLVVTLTVSSISLRTLNRTTEAIGTRQLNSTYNAATPAIDRAKAKLEFMFNRQRDSRMPSGIPGESHLLGMIINDGRERNGLTVPQLLITNDSDINVDPYTFPDEQTTASTFLGLSSTMDVDGNDRADRLDLDEDGLPDSAWAYRTDLDGDGATDATVAYSITLQTPAEPTDLEQASDDAVTARANLLQVRHGPLSNGADLADACRVNGDAAAAPIEAGWFRDRSNTSMLRKNFQIDAYVLPDNLNSTVATLEMHQDRQVVQGNKWGAWFRNDLEIFPGPQFNWNGAMHTEGNLIVGNTRFRGYLVSSPASCLYSQEASEITVADVQANPDEGIPAFQGQILSAKINDNTFGSSSIFHLFDDVPITSGNDNVRLDRDRDSVRHNSGTPKPADYALDPIALITRDVSEARGTRDSSEFRADDWNEDQKMFVKRGRIYNQSEAAPYLDDFYRADDRYGPKPRYAGRQIPGNIGEPIEGNLMVNAGLSDMDLVDNNTEEPFNVGIDGYWERRARREGLRLIVGQRLELGNAFGWGQDLNNDGDIDDADERNSSLYPPDQCPSDRCHENLQRRTLYDNLAAVQSLAVYHGSSDSTTFPVACYALTAHPGTAETINASRTFKESTISGLTGVPVPIETSFLTGEGTNGWEFLPPAGVTTEADFSDAIASNQPLGIALRNLAHFSGDPRGGAPSFTPIQDDVIHPYPDLSLWGDYSVLRRVLAMLDGDSFNAGNPKANSGSPNSGTTPVAYEDLSPADQSTLHTASCTLGMLAHNLNLSQQAYKTLYGPSQSNLGQLMWELIDGDLSNGEVNTLIGSPVNFPNGYDRNNDAADFYEQFSTTDYIEALKNKSGHSLSDRDIDTEAAIIITANQILRDRMLGFADGGFSVHPVPPSRTTWVSSTQPFTEGVTAGNVRLRTACDPDVFGTPANTAIVAPGNDADIRDERKIGLAMAFCSSFSHPKYPSLYYLFPVTDHDQDGADDGSDRSSSINLIEVDHSQPVAEEYISSSYIYDEGSSTGVNAGYIYIADEPGAIALSPRRYDLSDWVLPTSANSGVNEIYDSTGSRLASIPFLDKGIYNGREMMGLRVLDIDWGLIHNNTKGLGNDQHNHQDHWLPNGAVVYAAREDAVREDSIVRPTASGANWSICGHNNTFERTSGSNNGRCRMESDPADPHDPPLFDQNQISPKSVDYYPDPLRRPHGIRMRNGAEVWRENDNGRGLSIISDVPIYIQGNLNLHQTPGCNGRDSCRLEEFTRKLPTNRVYNDNEFYRDRTTLDTRFARPTTDLWRPTEVLADAVSITSENLCDGSMEDAFVTAGTSNSAKISDSEVRYECRGNSDRTTYLNQNRPSKRISNNGYTWLRDDPTNPDSPILISRNGMPMMTDGTDRFAYDDVYRSRDFYSFSSSKPLNTAATTRVNAIIISGLVPSRNDQAYGGMHNFPRFIEKWSRLYISGGLLQLNFSNYATAPFDQDAWETNQNTTGSERIKYYSPPNRLWGYDVGLQYSPAGPIAARFVTPQLIRSEFYSEPTADDPYMAHLCHQVSTNPEQQC
ncbi:MAG: hormogonium polysaccharide biosynthesis protein HpsA [Cyanobacteria bacterium J06627_8]